MEMGPATPKDICLTYHGRSFILKAVDGNADWRFCEDTKFKLKFFYPPLPRMDLKMYDGWIVEQTLELDDFEDHAFLKTTQIYETLFAAGMKLIHDPKMYFYRSLHVTFPSGSGGNHVPHLTLRLHPGNLKGNAETFYYDLTNDRIVWGDTRKPENTLENYPYWDSLRVVPQTEYSDPGNAVTQVFARFKAQWVAQGIQNPGQFSAKGAVVHYVELPVFAIAAGVGTYAPDAERVAAMFRNVLGWPTYQVVILADPSPRDILQAVNDVASHPRCTGDAIFAFYFSGHGIKQGSGFAFCTAGRTLLAADDLRSAIQAVGASKKLLLIDACYSGRLDASSFQTRRGKGAVGFQDVALQRGSIVMAACRPDEQTDGTSPFTNALIEAARNVRDEDKCVYPLGLFPRIDALCRGAASSFAEAPTISVDRGTEYFSIGPFNRLAPLGKGQSDGWDEVKVNHGWLQAGRGGVEIDVQPGMVATVEAKVDFTVDAVTDTAIEELKDRVWKDFSAEEQGTLGEIEGSASLLLKMFGLSASGGYRNRSGHKLDTSNGRAKKVAMELRNEMNTRCQITGNVTLRSCPHATRRTRGRACVFFEITTFQFFDDSKMVHEVSVVNNGRPGTPDGPTAATTDGRRDAIDVEPGRGPLVLHNLAGKGLSSGPTSTPAMHMVLDPCLSFDRFESDLKELQGSGAERYGAVASIAVVGHKPEQLDRLALLLRCVFHARLSEAPPAVQMAMYCGTKAGEWFIIVQPGNDVAMIASTFQEMMWQIASADRSFRVVGVSGAQPTQLVLEKMHGDLANHLDKEPEEADNVLVACPADHFPTPRICVLGSSGAGKSSVCNLLTQRHVHAARDAFPVSAKPSACTYQSKCRKGFFLGDESKAFTMIDTPGLNDPAGLDQQHIEGMVTTLRRLDKVTCFLLVFNSQSPRCDQSMKAMIKRFSTMFGRDFLNHTSIVFTRWYCDEASKERRADEGVTKESLRETWTQELINLGMPLDRKTLRCFFVDCKVRRERQQEWLCTEQEVNELWVMASSWPSSFSCRRFQAEQFQKREEELYMGEKLYPCTELWLLVSTSEKMRKLQDQLRIIQEKAQFEEALRLERKHAWGEERHMPLVGRSAWESVAATIWSWLPGSEPFSQAIWGTKCPNSKCKMNAMWNSYEAVKGSVGCTRWCPKCENWLHEITPGQHCRRASGSSPRIPVLTTWKD